MIKSKLFAAAALMGGSIGVANAVPMTFTDTYNPNDIYVSGNTSVQWTHDVTGNAPNHGFNAATDTVTGGKLTFWLYDDPNDPSFLFFDLEGESFKYSYNGSDWFSGGEIDNYSSSGNQDKIWVTPALSELADGKLSYTLKSKEGDFYFAKSELEVTVNRREGATSVPEPATLALLSLGLLGVGFGARRRRA